MTNFVLLMEGTALKFDRKLWKSEWVSPTVQCQQMSLMY